MGRGGASDRSSGTSRAGIPETRGAGEAREAGRRPDRQPTGTSASPSARGRRRRRARRAARGRRGAGRASRTPTAWAACRPHVAAASSAGRAAAIRRRKRASTIAVAGARPQRARHGAREQRLGLRERGADRPEEALARDQGADAVGVERAARGRAGDPVRQLRPPDEVAPVVPGEVDGLLHGHGLRRRHEEPRVPPRRRRPLEEPLAVAEGDPDLDGVEFHLHREAPPGGRPRDQVGQAGGRGRRTRRSRPTARP